jgi:hypothetical protein
MRENSGPSFSRRCFLAGAAALAGTAALYGRAQGQAAGVMPVRGRPRNLLAGTCSAATLKASLLPAARYRPFPVIQDRASWASLRTETQAGLLAKGQTHLHCQWPEMQATAFLEYARTGNRTGYESIRAARTSALRDLVFAECVESQGRFLDDITNGLWATCEESFWGVPAHLYLQQSATALPDPRDPVVDLFAAETSALLASAVYLLNSKLDSISPVIRERVLFETERRILQPLVDRNFAWMGLPAAGSPPQPVNNWNPWISWNWLTTSLLLDPDEDRRYRSVAKAMYCLDVFMNSYPDDGGCDEGPSYWNVAAGALFDALELLSSATGGAVDIFAQPLIAQMGLYMNRVHIAANSYLNPGDASPTIQVDVDKIFRYGRRLKNQDLLSLAVSSIPPHYMPNTLPAIFHEAALRAQPPVKAGLLRDVWLPDTRIMAARKAADAVTGLYLACIAANNGKSHSHNDTGSFWVYSEGLPVLIDMGQETYQKDSFGPHRYDIHSMQSAYHNLPTIGGVQQGVGPAFRATALAYQASESFAELGMELATAYPPQAMLKSWRRTVLLDRTLNRIEIDDDYVLTQPVADIRLSLMTPCSVSQSANGRLVLSSPQGAPATAITFDGNLLTAMVETITLENAELRRNWGNKIFRIQLKATATSTSGHLKLLIMTI